jgi:cellulose synthase/poly-beta-1,6-N-acetylglucosamine synthase-like glycosyltransferase
VTLGLALDLALTALSLPVLLGSLYLLALTLASARRAPPASPAARPRFDVLVPAHDEEGGIAATVASLLAISYPPDAFRVWVVADNCSDATAQRAQDAGARVIERSDPARRGKGYALALGFERLLAEGFADAIVVVDADTVASPNLLDAFAARLEAGAAVVQADDRVGNPGASWRTQLLAVAFTLVNTVRSLGRDRLGCSVGLRGNGMCFSAALLRAIPYDAFSIVEDLEYGIRLGEAGYRVRFAPEACVYAQMPAGEAASRSQRRRWEEGRAVVARRGPALLRQGIAARDRVKVELALDLLVPPLARLGGAGAAGLAAAVAVGAATGRPPFALLPWTVSVLALAVHVARGWWLSGTGAGGLLALAAAPLYVLWKVRLALTPAPDRGQWVRTAREPSTGEAPPLSETAPPRSRAHGGPGSRPR